MLSVSKFAQARLRFPRDSSRDELICAHGVNCSTRATGWLSCVSAQFAPIPHSIPAAPSPRSSDAGREGPPAAAPSRYLTRREAAAYVRCSLRFLDSMGLPFIRKGRCKVYDRIDLDTRMQQDKCRGRAWKETLWPMNVDSTAARTRGTGGSASFSRMDA